MSKTGDFCAACWTFVNLCEVSSNGNDSIGAIITSNLYIINTDDKTNKLVPCIMSKLPKATLNLKQFLLRKEVLKLYREIFRTLKRVPDESTRTELKEWARSDFRSNRHHTDENTIKTMLHYGRKSLRDLERNLSITK